jgi:hypothetical protein
MKEMKINKVKINKVDEKERKELDGLFELADIAMKEKLVFVPVELGKQILEHLKKLSVKYNFNVKTHTVDPRNGNIVKMDYKN